jgi:radical SAM superfamily enzyme YgiQ (UPF0313 family)
VKRILLLKAYQRVRDHGDAPPLGLLYLTTALRRRFGSRVEIQVRDMKARREAPDHVRALMAEFRPDVVGVSALNCEAESAHRIAQVVKEVDAGCLAVLGGPYAHNRAEEILESSEFDWCFNGEADHSFPEALDRYFEEKPLEQDIPGLSYRAEDALVISTSQDAIKDLDALGMPAWDLVDFDFYAHSSNFMAMLKGKRYATLFTSRGCPYLCNYCHDIFGKRFIHRSAENVLEEIEHLYENYGVDEFEIVDDIFNLHKPRLKKIMYEVKRRWRGKIHFCFPNGLRADIMDEEVVEALYQGGTYAVAIAIETVSDRLQDMADKHLDVEKARKVIEYFDERNIATRGFFMLGFPTETIEEIKATVDFALKSRLTMAFLFTVTPQPATPLFELAKAEDAEALVESEREERMGQKTYRADLAWYQRATGFDLGAYIQRSYWRFYLTPWRLWRILRLVPKRSLYHDTVRVADYLFRLDSRSDNRTTPRPE